jgi:hypothetical protein
LPFRNKVIWSPVEIDYLKAHSNDSINQLTIALLKSRNAINNKLAEFQGKPIQNKKSGKRTKIGRRKDCNNTFMRSGWEKVEKN